MAILEQIQQLERFTDTERAIIQYFLEKGQGIDKMPIQEIAESTYSSNASIIRLCRKLGYKGFREFKVALIRELESKKFVVNHVDYSVPFQPQESTETIVNRIYSLHKESMDAMQSALDIKELDAMVQHLLRARRVFLFGISDVNITLRGFMNKLLKIGIFPILATENTEEGNICPHITKDDCALFVTYSGSHTSYLYCAKILKKNHVPILLLTANPESPIYTYSTCRICVPDLERKEHIAVFYSQQVFIYILNLLYALLYREIKRMK